MPRSPSSAQPSRSRYRFTAKAPVSEKKIQKVLDACGKAGGTSPAHEGPGQALFATTPFARFGDLGSKVLPPAPSGTLWTAGKSAEVMWSIRYNHGGGYQYRYGSRIRRDWGDPTPPLLP